MKKEFIVNNFITLKLEVDGVSKIYINNKIFRHLENSLEKDSEFEDHCSNLQVWSENNYNTRLLHNDLSSMYVRFYGIDS